MDRLLFVFIIFAGILTLRGDTLGFDEGDTRYKTWFSGIFDESAEDASVEGDVLAEDTEFLNRHTDEQVTNDENMKNNVTNDSNSLIDTENEDKFFGDDNLKGNLYQEEIIPETTKKEENITNRDVDADNVGPGLTHQFEENDVTDSKQLLDKYYDEFDNENNKSIDRDQSLVDPVKHEAVIDNDINNDQVNLKEKISGPELDLSLQQNEIKNEYDYDDNEDSEKNIDKSDYEWVPENEDYYDDIDQIQKDLNKDIDQLVNTIKKLVNDEDDDEDQQKKRESKENQEDQFNLKALNEVDEDIKELFMDQKENELNLTEVNKTAQTELDKEAYILRLRQDSYDSPNNDVDYNIKEIDIKSDENNFDYDSDLQEDDESQDALVISEIENALEGIRRPESKEQNLLLHDVSDVNDVIEDNESPENLTDLINQFKIDHEDELDIFSEDFGSITPVVMRITFDDPLMISSPNYPEPYPPANTIDWIFEGIDGTGIEFNLTDLDLIGEAGDFLLVRPGSIDDADTTGLVFTYSLNERRNYRFYDYDTLFVRFHSESDTNDSHRGFTFSVKFIEKIEEEAEEVGQEEEVLIPLETLTVYVGGVTPQQFLDIAEDFRLIIADMATLYTNQHSIDVGNNTTSVVTKITGVSVCNLNWPQYESCVAVRFGVALSDMDDQYRLTEQELSSMWLSYSTVDPFSSRLIRLGIMEFAIPNDSAVLVSWVGVMMVALVLAALCGFFCWRWNCFDDYSRMSQYSGADLVSQGSRKSALSLYPTPHQTLPPLYEEPAAWHDDLPPKYSDTTQVDMTGAHTNQGFDKNDLLAFDSDEDIIMSLPDSSSPKNTTSSVRPKDLFEV